jgi:hypothetical protein
MTEEAQQKIRSMVEMAMNYVVEPQPLVVPAVPETLDALVEQLSSSLSISDSKTAPAAAGEQEEEVWDGEAFGVRLGKGSRVYLYLVIYINIMDSSEDIDILISNHQKRLPLSNSNKSLPQYYPFDQPVWASLCRTILQKSPSPANPPQIPKPSSG